MFVDIARAVDAGVKTVVGAKLREESAFGENFCGRSRHEQFVSIQRIDDLAGVERVKLDAEIGVSEFRADDDLLNAFRQSGRGLRSGSRGQEGRGKQ